MRLFCVLALSILSFLPGSAIAEHDTLLSYPCATDPHLINGELTDGWCLPARTTHFDQTGRVGMYIRCRLKGGNDEYVEGNCCKHLRESDAYEFRVCRGRTIPESGLGLVLQLGELGTNGWICRFVDCQLIGRQLGVPFL